MALLLSIGGSGQHIALAAARLVYLGALPPLDVVVIDADVSNALTKSLTTFGDTGIVGAGHPLKRLDIIPPLPDDLPKDQRFQGLFIRNEDDLKKDGPLFDVFFDERSADIKIQDGMFGNPAVGSTVFAHAAGNALEQVLALASISDVVHVAGSFVGGTGAGVIHQLLRALYRKNGEKRNKFFLVALLPWLRPPPDTSTEIPASQVSMQTNMNFGCDYLYHTSRDYIQSACLLGIPSDKLAGVQEATINVRENREYPHLLHAMACHFVYSAAAAAKTSDRPGEVLTYTYDPERPKWLLDAQWGEGKSQRPLLWFLQRAAYLAEVLQHIQSEKVAREFQGSFGLFGHKATYNLALWETIQKNQVNKNAKDLCTQVWDEFKIESKRLAFVLNWAESLFKTIEQSPKFIAFRQDKVKALPQVCTESLDKGQTGPRTAREIAKHFISKVNENYA